MQTQVRYYKPRWPTGHFVTDFAGSLLDQEEIEQHPGDMLFNRFSGLCLARRSFSGSIGKNDRPASGLASLRATWSPQHVIDEIVAPATSTGLGIRQIQAKIAGRPGRGVVGEITKRARVSQPIAL